MTQTEHSPLPANELQRIANRGRWHVVSTVTASKAGHVGGPLSAMDLLVALFFNELNIRPDQPDWPERDRFILSKGHSAIGLYSVMAMRGFFPEAELATFDKGDSRLQGHPDMTKLPGIETSTGSLGQGLSVGVGLAIGAKLKSSAAHTWVMLGDGELQEGMIWEAVHTATRYKLGNLTAIVDLNGLQQYGWAPINHRNKGDRTEPWLDFDLVNIFKSFGWAVVEFDGHDFERIEAAYNWARGNASLSRPTALIARTVKGKGLSYAEGKYAWHTGSATDSQLQQALEELDLISEFGDHP